VQRRAPELFDANGCQRLGPDQVSCASTAADADAAAAEGGPDGWRRLAGYVGPHWWTGPPTGAVRVLESTVATTAAPDGSWRALGLVRNEQAGAVAGAVVTAELLDHTGQTVESVGAVALVPSLRPGEPAPFVLAARHTPATAVASVRWSAAVADPTSGPGRANPAGGEPARPSEAVSGDRGSPTTTSVLGPSPAPPAGEPPMAAGDPATVPAMADPATRQVELDVYWTRAPGDPRRIDTVLHHDPAAGPVPLVVFGSVVNRGSATLERPAAVVAWLDGAGRVVAVQRSDGRDATGGAVGTLPPGSGADFLVSLDAAAAAAIPADRVAAPLLWGSAG
jgi:hypothetical protein